MPVAAMADEQELVEEEEVNESFRLDRACDCGWTLGTALQVDMEWKR